MPFDTNLGVWFPFGPFPIRGTRFFRDNGGVWFPLVPFWSLPNPRDAVLLGFDGFEIISGGFFPFCLDMLCFFWGGVCFEAWQFGA